MKKLIQTLSIGIIILSITLLTSNAVKHNIV